MTKDPATQSNSPGRNAKQKGNVVEDVVALLYASSDYVVKTRQRLPALDHSSRTREIDVLISGRLAGRTISLAVECKNYARHVKVGEMDEFISKLEDVGIPSQQGIFVAVNGFAHGAISRAKKAGVRALVLGGLTEDRFTAEIHQAFQSVVYLLLDVKNLAVTSEVEDHEAQSLLWFYGPNGRLQGSLLDLIWAKWRDGRIPAELGEHEVSVALPREWEWSAGGTIVPNSATATVRVVGVVVTEPGEARGFALKDAETGDLERFKIEGTFNTGPRSLPVTLAFTEQELRELLSEPAMTRITIGRVPLPRSRFGMYWPPSQRAVDSMLRRFTDSIQNALRKQWLFGTPIPRHLLVPNVKDMTFEEIEGTDLGAIWEPIMPSHLGSKDGRWPFLPRRPQRLAKANLQQMERRHAARRTSPPIAPQRPAVGSAQQTAPAGSATEWPTS